MSWYCAPHWYWLDVAGVRRGIVPALRKHPGLRLGLLHAGGLVLQASGLFLGADPRAFAPSYIPALFTFLLRQGLAKRLNCPAGPQLEMLLPRPPGARVTGACCRVGEAETRVAIPAGRAREEAAYPACPRGACPHSHPRRGDFISSRWGRPRRACASPTEPAEGAVGDPSPGSHPPTLPPR